MPAAFGSSSHRNRSTHPVCNRTGAIKQKKRGLLISLDEHPAQIIRNAETLGLDLKAQIENGTIHVLFDSPQELNIDAHFSKIVKIIEQNDIQRMVIDGMTSYRTALADQAVYRDFFHALVAYSKRRLMTTFFSYENPEFLGLSSFMPDFPVSSIVDNIILLSLVEINSALRRCLTVVKARGSPHEFDSREYVIEQGGIRLTLGWNTRTDAAAGKVFRHFEPGSEPPAFDCRIGNEVTPLNRAANLAPDAAGIFREEASLAGEELSYLELSREWRDELLDPAGWSDVLETFARTMKLAVALTDSDGRLLGKCHNPQPTWLLARDARPESDIGCPFCLAPQRFAVPPANP